MHRVQKLLQSTDPLTWVFDGDSITHGACHTFGWRDYTELFTERVRFELGRVQDIVIKTAFSGDATEELRRHFDRRVKQFQPQVVFIMIGMSDAFHPNEFGHRVFAECIFKELGVHDLQANTCRLFRP